MPLTLETPPPDLIVGIGELKDSKHPQGVIVTYALGSCLGVTCYDPLSKMGGMLHAMLPDSKAGRQSTLARADFIDTGVADLIRRVVDLGGNPGVFEFKVFGGAQTVQAADYFNIGSRNVKTMEALAAECRLQVKVWEVGGNQNRTIRFCLRDGSVKLRKPGQPEILL
jgi:chemotaxis protein CheD